MARGKGRAFSRKLVVEHHQTTHSPRVRGWKGELEPQNLNQMQLSPNYSPKIKIIKPKVIIISLDGIVFNNSKRFIKSVEKFPNKKRNFWNMFFSNEMILTDTLNPNISKLLWESSKMGIKIIYISSRRIDSKEITEKQIQYYDLPKGKLYLRGTNNIQVNYKKDVFRRILMKCDILVYVGNRLQDNELIVEVPIKMYNISPNKKLNTDDYSKILNIIKEGLNDN